MSGRPQFRGAGRRGGSGRNRGGGGGRGGGGRGEQRWWDPVWRAERLRQMQGEVETLNEDEWWGKMQKMKEENRQELIVKKNYGRDGQQVLADMAEQSGFYFHAYNKGKTLVISKVPLPNYRADLDERHGSTQKEIHMSTDVERRLENLLTNAKETIPVNDSSPSSSHASVQSEPIASVDKGSAPSTNNNANEKYSFELKNHQEKMKTSASAQVMQSFREKLPAYKMRHEFLEAVENNQVVVVSGETGCGKTTQLPQFILEEEISCLRGAQCNIICTQPRRISAISVSARIATERGESVGESVGYQIRLEAKRSAQTRLLFCTTGVLLRQLVQDPLVAGVSHLLVDEIHERGMNEDFLLIILHDLLPRRPDLRLILMSATINAEMFSRYFGNAPTIHIPGFTYPVRELFLEDLLEKTKYHIESEFDSFQRNGRRKRRQLFLGGGY